MLVLAAAIGSRWLLDPLMGDTLPLVTLFGAVAAAVWLSGLTAAAVVTIAGYLVSTYLFIEPRGSLGFQDQANIVGFGAYLFSCSLIMGFGQALRNARAREEANRETLRVTLRSIGDAVITTDVSGNVTYLNAVAETVTGWSARQALGQPLSAVFRIVNETTRLPVDNPADRALRDGVVVGLANHTVLIRPDGTECPIDDSAAPIMDEHGRVSGCVLIFRDVTAQRQVERDKETQLLTARRLASIVESSEVAIIGKNLDGIIESWNSAAELLFGYSSAEAVGRHISMIIPQERLAEEDQIIATLKAGHRIEHFETERMRADGGHVTVSLAVSPIKDRAGNVVGASKIVRDVTRERQAEAERNRLVTLIESSTDFIAVFDLDAVPIFINRAGLALVGLDNLWAARRVTAWDFFFPEDQARIRNELFPRVLDRGHAELEVRFRHFKTGEARWMAYKLLALTDAAGKPLAIGTVSQDITLRKKLEDNLRSLAAELAATDRRKDEFLATLAHELRGPLAPLANVLELWKRSSNGEQLQRARETMERQLGQLIRLVDDLLDLNRVTHDRLELRKARVELADVIEHAIEACRPSFDQRGQRLSVTLPKEPCPLYADPARLMQVFANLLSNSSKYTDLGGEISVSAQREGNAIVVSVRDNGIGIPADKLDRVFEMFEQVGSALDRSQGGLGIGLTLVRRLVGLHDGRVEARSAGLGKGSEFVVRLPVDDSTAEVAAVTAVQAPSRRRKFLVVDDNTDTATSMCTLLELAGHDAIAAHDGANAIEAAKKYQPEAVLLDIGLPQMDGHEVCRRLRELPDGKEFIIIAVTGWGQGDDQRKWQAASFDGHLVKPARLDALMALVTALDEPRSAAGAPSR